MVVENRHAPDYDVNLLELLHSIPGEQFSIDQISDFISSRIYGLFVRHYLRIRLFYHSSRGRIANPKRKHYRVTTPNESTRLIVDDCWAEFIQNAEIFQENRTTIADLSGKIWRILQIQDDGENDYVELVSVESETTATITFEHFSNAITRLNACGGLMERPDRRHSHIATFCALLPRLQFDENGYTVVTNITEPDTTSHEPMISVGGTKREQGEWNIRRKRAIHESDFEPQAMDSEHRILLTRERLERHELLVDFVWFEILGDSFDRLEGEFDLFSKNRTTPRILWEMKTIQSGDDADEKRQVRKAVSQLLYYDFKLGETGIHPLIACFEHEISSTLQRFLASCNIHCCWKYGSRLIFSNQLPTPSCLARNR